jgi:hypothetical protein
MDGIGWPHDATVGHIGVASGQIAGYFFAEHGSDAVLDCVLVDAGKYRNGAARQWCRTHQHYRGVKADLAALAASGRQGCAQHAATMGYALHPPLVDLAAFASVRIGATPDGAMLLGTTGTGPPEAGALSQACGPSDAAGPAHARATRRYHQAVDARGASEAAAALPAPPATHARLRRCAAVAIRNSGHEGGALFPGTDIVQVNITPPALLAYTTARAAGRALGCVCCARCGHPHLDLGSFAQTPHRRHCCGNCSGNCGCDSTHSRAAMVSSPLHALCQRFGKILAIV